MTGTERLARVLNVIAAMPEKDQRQARNLARAVWEQTKRGRRGTFFDAAALSDILYLEPKAALAFGRRHLPAIVSALGLSLRYNKSDYTRGGVGPFGGGRVQRAGDRYAYHPANFEVDPVK
jgi:hypothetical protein